MCLLFKFLNDKRFFCQCGAALGSGVVPEDLMFQLQLWPKIQISFGELNKKGQRGMQGEGKKKKGFI